MHETQPVFPPRAGRARHHLAPAPGRAARNLEEQIAEAAASGADALVLNGAHFHGELPRALLGLGRLRHLALVNFTSPLPEWICDLKSLHSLEIAGPGRVDALLSGLGRLDGLRRLALWCPMREIPASVARLRRLKELEADFSGLDHFPPALASLTCLETLAIGGRNRCDPDETFEALLPHARLKCLRFEHWGAGLGEDVAPASLGRLTSLEELDFSGWTDLRALPESIGQLKRLAGLTLANPDCVSGRAAHLEELPESLCGLPLLERLSVLGQGRMRRLPKSLPRLKRLKSLNILHSGIVEPPLSKHQLAALEELYLQGPLIDLRKTPRLRRFAWIAPPQESRRRRREQQEDLTRLGLLKSLVWLSLEGVELEAAPFLTRLPGLRYFHIGGDIAALPSDLDRLKKLRDIYISDAPSLKSLPESLRRLPALKSLHLTRCGVTRLNLPQGVKVVINA